MATNYGMSKKMKVAHQEFSAVLGTSSTFVKFICISLCVGYLLSFSSRALSYICILPGNLIPPNFWIWTCFTHNFIEIHWWVLMCDIMVVFLYGKLLEPLWGALEMGIFFTVVSLSVAGLTTITYLVVYLVTQDPDYLFNNYVHGLAGYLAGFSVAVKQTMPDHVLISSPFGKLRNRHVPLLLIAAAVTARLCGIVDPPFPIMFVWGSFVSWVYLRFYQRHSSGSRGDMAESFALASFFPSRLSPFISLVSNMVFALFVYLKICRQPQRKYDVSSPTTITVTLPGANAQEVERRRLLAIKALNERLSSASTESTVWPNMVDGSGGGSGTGSDLSPDTVVNSVLPDAPSASVAASLNNTVPSTVVMLPVNASSASINDSSITLAGST